MQSGDDIVIADTEEQPDVLPAWANTVMASGWILLFGGRWLLVPLVQAAGLVSPDQVAEWDANLLTKVYLILLSITCIVLALRVVRRVLPPVARPASLTAGRDDAAPPTDSTA